MAGRPLRRARIALNNSSRRVVWSARIQDSEADIVKLGKKGYSRADLTSHHASYSSEIGEHPITLHFEIVSEIHAVEDGYPLNTLLVRVEKDGKVSDSVLAGSYPSIAAAKEAIDETITSDYDIDNLADFFVAIVATLSRKCR